MKSRLMTIAAAITALGLATAAPGAAHSSTKCSLYACEEVVNAYAGSNYVYTVSVWAPTQLSQLFYHRLLFNGYQRGASVYRSGVVTWGLDYYVNPGTCIQGGIVGLPNARTPCWYAPYAV